MFWVLDTWLLGFGLFALLMGALFLWEAAVYVRHFRAIVLYALVKDGTGAEGQIRCRRWLLLRSSGAELMTFAILFLVFYFLFESLFTPGRCVGLYSDRRAAPLVVEKSQAAGGDQTGSTITREPP